MKKNVLKLIFLITLLGLMFNMSLFSKKKDILIGIKLYQGERVKTDKTPEVVSSFSMKPLYGGKLIPEDSYKNERKEIKRIFHLKNISVLAETKWGWGNGEERNHVFNVAINGKFFVIHTNLDRKGTFNIEVKLKKGTKWASLLKTGVLLPQQQSIVIGFEDPEKRPYFLSIYRGLDQDIGFEKKKGSLWVKKNEIPEIKKYVKPELTEKIKKRGKGGFVVAIALIDTKGKVIGIEKIRGDSILSKSVKDAVFQWEYNPFFIDGKAVPVKFTVGVEFNLKDDSRWSVRSSADKGLKYIPSIWPVRGYITSTFGYRINPFTKVKEFHSGLDISSRMGNEIIATAEGIIKMISFDKIKGYYITIDHKNGYETEFWHLQKQVFVKKGDCVLRGHKIASIGNSGRSTGPHLHYEVRKDGKPVNPVDFIFQ